MPLCVIQFFVLTHFVSSFVLGEKSVYVFLIMLLISPPT